MKYRKKPIEIEAIQWDGKNINEISFAFPECFATFTVSNDNCIQIKTLEGIMTARMGDYIIRGVKGEFYPCKPDIFEATYEKVEESA